MGTPAIRTRRWTRIEYERLIEKGIFLPDDRLELLAGELVVREPQGTPHAVGIQLAVEALRRPFGPGWQILGQLPVALDDESEPEPDVCTVSRLRPPGRPSAGPTARSGPWARPTSSRPSPLPKFVSPSPRFFPDPPPFDPPRRRHVEQHEP